MRQVNSWRIVATSEIGSSHEKTGTPCQDNFVAKVFLDHDGDEVLAVVVSDGAGSASRADVGSATACRTLVEAVELFLGNSRFVDDISSDVLRSWIKLFQDEVMLKAEQEGLTSRDFACTLLFAAISSTASAIAQVGDGAIVVSDDDGWSWVHWPQRGEYANTTFFLTDPASTQRVAFSLTKSQINEVALFTDGLEPLVLDYASQTVHGRFFDQMFPAVRALSSAGLSQSLSEALRVYLRSRAICDRTDDDKTLVLATRRSNSREGKEEAAAGT